ncbi:MAG: MoxR family ATPase [Clostridiales bacterium]|nr:MoxR family ATPase [Clostridiales bacterium]
MLSAQSLLQQLEQNIAQAVVGKEEAVELLFNALLCGGHVLIEDVPGVGKTTLASAFARSLALSFKRIQFTPDVTPSDVTGYSVMDFKTGDMHFKQGAVFCNLLLADEINRTSPKTQSSLLEVMQEGQVTADGVTRQLRQPFMVLATQNPVDFVGTYPLPEAQLDRFFMRIEIGYPSREEEIKVLEIYRGAKSHVEEIEPICGETDILELQQQVTQVRVSREMRMYITNIAQASRSAKLFGRGISTRGAIALMRAAQAGALTRGRDYVIPEDVRDLASPVLAHRLSLSPEARISQKNASEEKALTRLIASIPVPVRSK